MPPQAAVRNEADVINIKSELPDIVKIEPDMVKMEDGLLVMPVDIEVLDEMKKKLTRRKAIFRMCMENC
jgi:hypothetical protein